MGSDTAISLACTFESAIMADQWPHVASSEPWSAWFTQQASAWNMNRRKQSILINLLYPPPSFPAPFQVLFRLAKKKTVQSRIWNTITHLSRNHAFVPQICRQSSCCCCFIVTAARWNSLKAIQCQASTMVQSCTIPLHDHTDVTVIEAVVALGIWMERFNIGRNAMEVLLQLISNKILGGLTVSFPKTHYLFKQTLGIGDQKFSDLVVIFCPVPGCRHRFRDLERQFWDQYINEVCPYHKTERRRFKLGTNESYLSYTELTADHNIFLFQMHNIGFRVFQDLSMPPGERPHGKYAAASSFDNSKMFLIWWLLCRFIVCNIGQHSRERSELSVRRGFPAAAALVHRRNISFESVRHSGNSQGLCGRLCGRQDLCAENWQVVDVMQFKIGKVKCFREPNFIKLIISQ